MPIPRRATTHVAAPLLAALLLSGCGGESHLSRRDFVARANAVCKRVNRELAGVGPATSAADVVRIGPGVIRAEQQGLTDLRKLNPPSGLSADWRRLLGDLGQLTAHAGELVAAARTNDAASAQRAATASTQLQAEITRVAGHDGLTDCAQG